jgi:hypothetical protein
MADRKWREVLPEAKREKACVAGVATGKTYHFRRLFFVTFFWRQKKVKEI